MNSWLAGTSRPTLKFRLRGSVPAAGRGTVRRPVQGRERLRCSGPYVARGGGPPAFVTPIRNPPLPLEQAICSMNCPGGSSRERGSQSCGAGSSQRPSVLEPPPSRIENDVGGFLSVSDSFSLGGSSQLVF